jgi:hypothetical protein
VIAQYICPCCLQWLANACSLRDEAETPRRDTTEVLKRAALVSPRARGVLRTVVVLAARRARARSSRSHRALQDSCDSRYGRPSVKECVIKSKWNERLD